MEKSLAQTTDAAAKAKAAARKKGKACDRDGNDNPKRSKAPRIGAARFMNDDDEDE